MARGDSCMDELLVNEIYGPVNQGEGKSSGRQVSFLRLAACNLACIFCDTPYTWNWTGTKFNHSEKFDKKKEARKYSVDEVRTKLNNLKTNRIVISGGEPFLQQVELIPLLEKLKSDCYDIEVETNGTIAPLPEFLKLVDQINCSPKTSNSGVDNRISMRERPRALRRLSSSDKTSFKFVVSSSEDMREIIRLIDTYQMREVYLMPKGRTSEEQLKRQDSVRELATDYGLHFSPRLHVLEFDNKRGV